MIKVKVCGMRDAENIAALTKINPDFIGFIFYDKSPRYVGEMDENILKAIPKAIKKVGVFVNANPDYIIKNAKKYDLQYVQLHGHETPDFCRNLKTRGINIIKAFLIDDTFNFSSLNNYKPHTDYFLFDTKGTQIGGNGVTFDWNLLKKYDNEKPFFLSGGLSLENIEQVAELSGLRIYGLDVNSNFEIEPALKDIDKIAELLEVVRPVEEEV